MDYAVAKDYRALVETRYGWPAGPEDERRVLSMLRRDHAIITRLADSLVDFYGKIPSVAEFADQDITNSAVDVDIAHAGLCWYCRGRQHRDTNIVMWKLAWYERDPRGPHPASINVSFACLEPLLNACWLVKAEED
jgi:hypothetical protein